jgi:hypothetical protein
MYQGSQIYHPHIEHDEVFRPIYLCRFTEQAQHSTLQRLAYAESRLQYLKA